MNIKFDKETDALWVHLAEGVYEQSDEVAPGILLDYDAQGKLLAIEILDASEKVNPLSLAKVN